MRRDEKDGGMIPTPFRPFQIPNNTVKVEKLLEGKREMSVMGIDSNTR